MLNIAIDSDPSLAWLDLVFDLSHRPLVASQSTRGGEMFYIRHHTCLLYFVYWYICCALLDHVFICPTCNISLHCTGIMVWYKNYSGTI